MKRCRNALAGTLIAALAWPAIAPCRDRNEPAYPVFETGTATLRLDDRSLTIAYSLTGPGPLVALEPLVARLGGELELGPLRQSHKLTLNESIFVFGPQSPALTAGEEIISLSQPPVAGAGGLHVPLDLLRKIYGDLLGYDFEWRPSERTLGVGRQPVRELPVVTDLVHLQGVTTLVFQFPTRPRYRLRRSPTSIEIEMVGDRLRPDTRRRLPDDPLVRRVSITPESIRVDLSRSATAQDYVLESPFRLVFDVVAASSGAAPSEPIADREPSRRRAGIHTIVIDPGHGGGDTGAQGADGSLEKDFTLTLARSLERRLESRLPVTVELTRNEDAELPLETRSALANQYKADLFISLHINSSVVTNARGAETYFLSLDASDERAAAAAEEENQPVAAGASGDPLFDLQLILWDLAQSHHLEESRRLAGIIQEELNLALGLRDRGVRQAPFKVLMGAAMPAVLVELGFLSNPEEEAKLADPAYRAQLIDALVRAIMRYRAQVGGGAALEEEIPR